MAQRLVNPLLKGSLFIYPIDDLLYEVTVTKKGITYKNTEDGKTEYLHFGDVIGCRCKKSKNTEERTAYFTVFAYPFQNLGVRGKLVRIRKDLTFGTNENGTFEENLSVCRKWKNVISHLCRGLDIDTKDVDTCKMPEQRHLLILINPHSGPGKAKQIYDEHVAPMLDQANIKVTVSITEYAGHATNIMKSLDLKKFHGVVIVSGDGLIYEVINGLMQRPDWKEAIHYPIGCVPGGSGNALCWSINYTAGEPLWNDMTLYSTLVLIKHRIVPMDLVLIQTPTSNMYSFLSLTWGIIADIDYESEKLRAIGAARFTVYALLRIMKLRSYKGELSFLPAGKYFPRGEGNRLLKSKSLNFKPRGERTMSASVSSEVFSNNYLPHHTFANGRDGHRANSVPKDVGHSETLYNSHLKSLVENEENMENVDDGECNNHNTSANSEENGHVEFGLPNEADPQEQREKSESSAEGNVFECSHPLLPSLSKELPSNWVTIRDEFVTVFAVYQPYLGPDNLAAPDSRLNDGFIHLMFVRAGIPKATLLSFFLALSQGEHINSPYCEVVKVLAFRLLPELTAGNIMVDGERIELGPVQGQILPSMARIMAIQ